MSRRILLYGATGLSGMQLAEALSGLGDRLVLAGRSADPLAVLSRRLGLPARRFALDDHAGILAGLAGIDILVNAAGPFVQTAAVLAQACLRTGTDYLDLTGEWPVFERLLAEDEPARIAGSMLLPGIGVGIAITDCLLAVAARRFPATVTLRLGMTRPHLLGRGSVRTMLGLADSHALVRRDGKVVRVAALRQTRDIDFGHGPVRMLAFSWPDVITVERSTGVRNFSAHVEASPTERIACGLGALAAPLLRHPQVAPLAQQYAGLWPAGPGAATRQDARQIMTVEAEDRYRRISTIRAELRDAYTVTTEAAAAIIRAVAGGRRTPGFTTPSALMGPDFVTTLASVRLLDAATPTLLSQEAIA